MIADTTDMQDLRQWLCWRSEERDGKPTKVPYSPRTGQRAQSTAPETWGGYNEAVKAYEEHGYDGIGFVFTPEDDLCGVDLDKCVDPETGEIEEWAQEVIEELDSYTEISPSGTGVHVLVNATLPEGRNRKGRFEAYDRGRYFTVTGKHLAGTPQTVERRQEELGSVVRGVFGEESTNGHTMPVAASERLDNGLSDSEVIQKALAASNGARFSRLWNGDTGGYGSHSEADLALCGMLAFWTGGDASRIDSLFRQSGLYRTKWERKDYRNRTITEALSGKTEFYKAPKTVKLADGTERKAEEKEERRNQADRLIGYALEDVQDLFVDQHGAPHALIAGEPVPLTSRCYSWLRRLMWEEEGRSVSGEYLKMAAGTLSAHAEFSGVSKELYTRAAWHEGLLYYELRPSKVVRVGPAGWNFEANPPVLFRRYVNLKALPDPQAGGSLDVLDGLVNLKSERDRRLFKAYLVTLPLEHVGRPILNASGAMGSGKTTIQRLIKRLLDPTAPETVRFDPRDFLQKAMHAFIVMADNQNTIPEWAADTLCRLVTGEADSKRRLYTDDEDFIIELRRAALLNGINLPTDRGDVLDRSLVVELERIPDGDRKTEEQIWELFAREHPGLLGALFDTLSKAIALKPSLKLSRRPRLADWGEYAASIYEVMGWGSETFLNDWDEVVKVQNQATLDGSPVAQAIIKFMEDKEEYTGTSSEMHSKLKVVAAQLGVDVDRDKAWPKSARWLWRRIKEVLPLLVAAGIEASRGRDESAKQITLRKIPTNDGSDGSGSESRTDKGKTHADTAQDDGRSNGSDGANGRSNGSKKPPNNAPSANNADTANRYGDFSEEASTLEQEERIRRLVGQGMSETWARRTVLADSHPLDCDCEVCL
jgi:putative DNA primase/helicase